MGKPNKRCNCIAALVATGFFVLLNGCASPTHTYPLQVSSNQTHTVRVGSVNTFHMVVVPETPQTNNYNPWFSVTFSSRKTPEYQVPIALKGKDEQCNGEYTFYVRYMSEKNTIQAQYFDTTVRWGEAVDIQLIRLENKRYEISVNGEKKVLDVDGNLRWLNAESNSDIDVLTLQVNS